MSLEAMSWAIRQEVGGNEKLVLILLGNRMNPDHGCCWPKLQLLSEEAGISYATAKRVIAKLVESGLIVTFRTSDRDGFLGGFRFYFADDRISPKWRHFKSLAQNEPTGNRTAQNEPLEGSNCALGGAQNEPAKTVRRNSKGNSKDSCPKPSASDEEKSYLPTAVGEDTFETFWAKWPSYRKPSKKEAMLSFARAMKRARSFTLIMQGLDRHLKYWPTSKSHRLCRTVPHPTTWLNQNRWEASEESIQIDFRDDRKRGSDVLSDLYDEITGENQ